MRKIATLVLAMALVSNVASAGPLRDAVTRAGQATRPVKSGTGDNKMLWPGVGLLAAGGLLALYGFTHTTGAEINTNTSGTSISVSEKKSTGVGFAGLAIAGVGGVLLVMGQNQAKPNKKVVIGFNKVTIRF